MCYKYFHRISLFRRASALQQGLPKSGVKRKGRRAKVLWSRGDVRLVFGEGNPRGPFVARVSKTCKKPTYLQILLPKSLTARVIRVENPPRSIPRETTHKMLQLLQNNPVKYYFLHFSWFCFTNFKFGLHHDIHHDSIVQVANLFRQIWVMFRKVSCFFTSTPSKFEFLNFKILKINLNLKFSNFQINFYSYYILSLRH